MTVELEPETVAFYRHAMTLVRDAGVPFLVGGAYAMQRYTGIARHTKDFDIFVRPADADRALAAFEAAGYRTERTFPHWLGKAFAAHDAFVDVIYRSGNGVCEVDDDWFGRATADEVLGLPARLCPAQEIVWSKSYIMERERFDGADVAHLLREGAGRLDWDHLLARFGDDWRVLLAHLTLFGFTYPAERTKIPARIMRELAGRLVEELDTPGADDKLCRGTLLSRGQYLIDVERWGYEDVRLAPRGQMTRDDIDLWTEAIARDGTRT